MVTIHLIASYISFLSMTLSLPDLLFFFKVDVHIYIYSVMAKEPLLGLTDCFVSILSCKWRAFSL